jgi:hypothetical protein
MLPQQGVLGLTRERPRQNILLTILHHNKGIETCFSRRRNLTVAKKGIETCVNTRRNLKRQERHVKMFLQTQKSIIVPTQTLPL